MGEPTRPRLPMRLPAAQSTSEDDRSTPMCRRGSRRPPSPRSFGVGITSSEFRETARAFACDQRTQSIVDQGSTFLRPGHPLRRFDQLFIEINCRTHVSTSSDASIVHHMMHIPCGELQGNGFTRSSRRGGENQTFSAPPRAPREPVPCALLTREIRGALFQEGAHPFLRVVAGAEEAEE